MNSEKPNAKATEKSQQTNPRTNPKDKQTPPSKFEDRMSIVVRSLSEFHVTDQDFPSLSNVDGDDSTANKSSIKPDLPSYSATLSKSAPSERNQNVSKEELRNSSQLLYNADSSKEVTIDEGTSMTTVKKKRKRAKKKKKNVAIPEELNENSDSPVQINLEDIEEYPDLLSSIGPSVKSIGVTTPKMHFQSKPVPSTPLKPTQKEVKIPGILNVKPPATPNEAKIPGKKYNTPVKINILDVLVVPKKQSEVKAKKASLTFNVKKAKVNMSFKNNPHNVLDSTAPVRKRGKEREKPKKNKLTKLKKIILFERALRKQQTKSILDEMEKDTLTIEEGNTTIISEGNETEASFDITPIDISQNSIDKGNIEETVTYATLKTDFDGKLVVVEAVVQNTEVLELITTVDLPVSEENIFIQLENESNKDNDGELILCVKKIVHSRKYRDYCYQRVSQEIDSTLEILLQDLVRFQDRQFQKDPIKAKIRKRMVFGIKEVTKNIKINKIKFVIIAPDVERIASEGGLNDALSNLISLCEDNKIPVVFGLPRRKLGHVCKKPVPVSCIGVISYEGTEESYKKLMDYVTEARDSYKSLLMEIEKLITPEIKNCLLNPDLEDKKLQEMKKNIFQQLNI